jgi:replicative DNA helicase
MADVELAFISKALQEGAVEDVISRGIDADHFADEDIREVFDWSIDHLRHHKNSPSIQAVKEEFPGFSTVVSKDPLSYHMERFIKKVRERTASELALTYLDAIEDPDEIDEIELRALDMARTLNELIPQPRAMRYSDGQQRKKEYDRRLHEGEQHGISFGIPSLDEVTLGMQPHELVTSVAYMGVGKTTLMQSIAYAAYLQGKSSIFISLEVEAEALMRKIDVMASGIRYWALKALELDVGERAKWEAMLEKAEEDRHERDIIVIDDIQNCTIDHVQAAMMRYKPDVAFVDYLELMKTPRGVSGQHWEQVSYSGQGLKAIARVMKIPVVTAAQLTREGGKGDIGLHNVSFQSIGKHSDVMIGLAQDEDKEARKEMDVILLKNRDGKKARAEMRWDLETMDIHEKGAAERFPQRRPATQSLIGKDRKKARRLEVARNVPQGDNAFTARAGKKSSSKVTKIKAKAKKPNAWQGRAAA